MLRKYSNKSLLDFIQSHRSRRAPTSGLQEGEGASLPFPASSSATGHREEVPRHMGTLFDSVTTAIISLDGGGRVVVFNAAAETLFKLPRVMVIGRAMGEAGKIMGFEERSLRALWERLLDAVWAAGAALDLEYDLVMKNGARRVISYSVYPLGRLAWSVENGVVILLEDITRKKEMEEQISDAHKRLQEVFDGITDGIQVVDEEFRVTAVNGSMNILAARPIKIGTQCYEACFSGTRRCEPCPALDTFRSGRPASVTKRIASRAANGRDPGERVVEINTFPLLDRRNRVVQVVEYIKDVTERVRLAERLEHTRKLAELGEMAARIAHEVRNPLNAITGAAHFLSSEFPESDTIQNFTSLIKRQSNRVDRVASDLLSASKPLRLTKTSVQINAAVEQAMASLGEQMYQQGIKVASHLGAAVPLIQADELQIEQAMYNIIKNAVEAMPSGGTLRLRTKPMLDGAWVEVIVEDSGPGISDEDQERIFQSFYTTKLKGTGLGLTIVQGVLKNHCGKILIERGAGGGARVVVCLPVRTGDGGGRPSCEHIQCPGYKLADLSPEPIMMKLNGAAE